MNDIAKPGATNDDEEDPFLIPSGQTGSYVDTLAVAQRTTTAIRIGIGYDIVVLLILEAPQWTSR